MRIFTQSYAQEYTFEERILSRDLRISHEKLICPNMTRYSRSDMMQVLPRRACQQRDLLPKWVQRRLSERAALSKPVKSKVQDVSLLVFSSLVSNATVALPQVACIFTSLCTRPILSCQSRIDQTKGLQAHPKQQSFCSLFRTKGHYRAIRDVGKLKRPA